MKYTIGITTFEHRFEKYFKPLLLQIKKNLPDIEVIVYVNGQYGRDFNENYRSNLLEFISQQNNVFPIVSPYFKGLSKIWNSIVVQSSNDNLFILNDDIWLDDSFFSQIPEMFKVTNYGSFRLNGSFSHFCVNRKEIFEVGFFDERLIGLGEEDGDWCFRWEKFYQKHLPVLQTPFVHSFYNIKDDKNSENMEKDATWGKYTPWNARWIFSNKYDPDDTQLAISQGFPANGQGGMYGKPVAIRKDNKELDYYPAEKFFWDHINELKNKEEHEL